MMEKQSNLQLELFKQSNDPSGLDMRTPTSSFLSLINNYERTILIIIAIAITGIVSFSLGVEKGKRLVLRATSPGSSEAIITPRVQVESGVIKSEEPIKQSIPLEKRNYVIQLASYKVKTHAQKEAELLKKRGLFPLILSKGSYIVLCVGNISDKQAALTLLAELRKRYRDCYLTRL